MIAYFVDNAWKATALREAYLPDLRAEAASSTDGPLLALLGGRLIQTVNPELQEEAATDLTRAASYGENREIVWRNAAAAYALSGNTQQALDTLQTGKQRLGGNAPEISRDLDSIAQLGPSAGAMDVAAVLLPDGPDPLVAQYAKGSWLNGLATWYGHRHPDRSGFTTRELWARDEPKNADAQRLWGEALIRNLRFREAQQTLAGAVALAPNSAAAHLDYAQALDRMGADHEAVNEYLQAIALDHNSVAALLSLGQVWLRDNSGHARDAFQRAVKIAPDSADAWIGLGSADMRNPMYANEGVDAFAHAARLAPSRTDYYPEYARELQIVGRLDEAEAMLNRCESLTPDDPAVHAGLAGVILQNNPTPARLSIAEDEARQALKLDPGATEAKRSLGEILLREGSAVDSIAVLKQVIADNPNEVTARHTLARAYAALGQTSLATQTAADAARLETLTQQVQSLKNQIDSRYLDPQYHRDLLKAYQAMGDKAGVAEQQRALDALQNDPQGTSVSFHAYHDSIERALGNTSAATGQ